jgi:hypothetical protein
MGRKAKVASKISTKSKTAKTTDSGSDIFERYFAALRKTELSDKTEHTDRAALEHLLQAIAAKTKATLLVQHEPKRAIGKGAPDFKVKDGALILGYVENKTIGENLSRVLRSDQLTKYKDLSGNIVVTDYLAFIWLNKDETPQRASLCDETDFENADFEISDEAKENVLKLLTGFFSTPAEGIGKAQELALALATRGRLLRDYLGEELGRQEFTLWIYMEAPSQKSGFLTTQ